MTDASRANQGEPTNPLDRLANKLQDVNTADAELDEVELSPFVGDNSEVPIGLKRLGDFELLERIRAGGMGAVYLARQRSLDKLVAVKVIRPDFTYDVSRVARFRGEALAASKVQHPGIVSVHFVGEQDGVHYIAQELIEGGRTLDDLIQERRDAPPKDHHRSMAELFAKIADALEAVHQAEVIHRDIKPGNILITPRGEPKVADFGLAKDLASVDQKNSAVTPGTAHYKSPEHIDKKVGPVDARSDLFSLGVSFYEALTFTLPFVGTQEEAADRIQHHEVDDLRAVSASVPTELSVICRKCLEKEPRRRYQSMAELAADLRRYLDNQPIRAQPPSATRRAQLWVRRNKVASVLIAAAILVAGTSTASVLAISATNVELESQKTRAERNEALARQQEQVATKNLNDVLALSAQKDHDDLVADAEKLWPAHPEMIPAYEDWLRRANELINGRPADELKGLKKRPSLAEHKAKLAELRAAAKPLSEDQIRAERESHPRYAELLAKRSELEWLGQTAGLRFWTVQLFEWANDPRENLDAWIEESRRGRSLGLLDLGLSDEPQPGPIHWDDDAAVGSIARADRFGLVATTELVFPAGRWRLSVVADDGIRVWVNDELLIDDWQPHAARQESCVWLSDGRDPTRIRLQYYELSGGAILRTWLESAETGRQTKIDWRSNPEFAPDRRARHASVATEVADLERVVGERRTYEFEDPEQEWWNRQLVKLVSDLEALRDPQTGLMNDVLAEPFGWGVAKRYAFAQSIGERSVDGAEAKRLWSEAIAAIKASPKYGGLEIAPQLDLLPIGRDPDSLLWEFAHLQTGDPAVRGADGKLVLTEETGLVFVLIPGGTFWMGAQNKPGAQNHDPLAGSEEGPVHEVELSPYFLSKYEMTQGQWQRIAATNPSGYQPPGGWAPSLLHPVEQVNWPKCFDLLESLGLSLPSEAQWECGARGGTTTAWWTGQERESLRGMVNLADQTAKKAGAPWPDFNDWPELEDGSVVHCAVGKYAANGFGLHEVAGNVWEWCLDGYDSGFYGKQSGKDPLLPWSGTSIRVARGGGFGASASYARSAVRITSPPEPRNVLLGLRPSRALRLSPSPLHPPK
ncbi:MAG: SUMF1/EgtB/PvdO family nonheme iron enzyme [Planctomycetes bacterium]|nr:SUMF1/EgtB/PvdO family nonheme iron enzyme [Planctomycetota bacterium]